MTRPLVHACVVTALAVVAWVCPSFAQSPSTPRTPWDDPDIQGNSANTRGRWEGDTLVVETTNFRDENVYRGANEGNYAMVNILSGARAGEQAAAAAAKPGGSR